MVTIRRGTQEDAAGICRVHTTAIRQICAAVYAPQEIEAWAGPLRPESYHEVIAQRVVLVAVEDGTVVGFGQLNPESSRVEAVYVLPGHVRRGIGGKLLGALEAAARDADLSRLELSATLNSVPFYTSVGYRSTGEGKHQLRSGAEIACVHMVKELRPK